MKFPIFVRSTSHFICRHGALAILLAVAPLAHAYNPVVVAGNMQVLHADMPTTDYRLVASNEPGQLFFAGEPVNLKFVFATGKSSGTANDYALEIQEIGTRTPGRVIPDVVDFLGGGKEPQIEVTGNPVRFPIAVTFGNGKESPVAVDNLPVPNKFGIYALILTRGTMRQFVGTVARLPRPRPDGTVDNTPLLADGSFFDRPERYMMRAGEYARLGLHGFRGEISWAENEKGDYDWSRYDPYYAALSANHIQELATLEGSPAIFRPFGDPTPASGWTKETGGYSGTGDWECDPKYYPRFGKWITAFCQRYYLGGKGGLWALENYNEPWEGGGISGWARDMLQYRELQKTIADSARAADPHLRIAAACSIMNTEDKFYSKGDREFDQYVDLFTDHYVAPPMCYGPMVAAAHGKESMESETWLADAEYKLPQAAAQFMASGQKHIAPWQPGEVFDSLPGNDDQYFMPGPVAVATAAFNYFTTGHPFQRIVFQKHLPWVFQYGADDDKSSLLILFGQLSSFASNNPKERLWAQVDSSPGGTITIDNHDRLLQFYDTAGNPIYDKQRKVTLPLDIAPTYITCSRGPIAAAARLEAARIDDKRPVEILPHDFTTPIDTAGAVLTVEVHNCLNRPITGTLTISAPAGINLKMAAAAAQIAAGETVSISFPLAASTASPSNAYPFSFHFAGDGGAADYSETLNSVCIPKRTISIDGNLDDWKGIPGIVIVAQQQNVDVGELARQPWLDLKSKQPDGSFGEFKLAWDDDNLYISARVNNPHPQMDKPRQQGLDPNSFFHTAADDNIEPYKSFLVTHPGHSFGEVPYVYNKSPEPPLAYRGDRIQFGFDVTPGMHDMISDTDRVPYGFHAVPDTDYEYSAYLCADGKGELWRLLAPGVPRVHDFPREPKGARSTGPVPGGQCVVRQDGNTRIYELAIPRAELADLKLAPGTNFGFTMRIGQADGHNIDFGADKAVTKINGLTLHPYWEMKPSCGVRWQLGN